MKNIIYLLPILLMIGCSDINESQSKKGEWSKTEREMCKKTYLSIGHMMEMDDGDEIQFVDCLCENLEQAFPTFEKINNMTEDNSTTAEINKVKEISESCISDFVMTGWKKEDKIKCKSACLDVKSNLTSELGPQSIPAGFEDCMCKKLEVQFYSWDLIEKRLDEGDKRVINQIEAITQECLN
tara:strand:+ start:214 stop:762 length:549 start_codon:yes stop_codon:yes gene_type:complete